jgi:hypothetical protein
MAFGAEKFGSWVITFGGSRFLLKFSTNYEKKNDRMSRPKKVIIFILQILLDFGICIVVVQFGCNPGI